MDPRPQEIAPDSPLGAAGAEEEALLRVAAAAAGAYGLDAVLALAADEARTAVRAASLSVSRWDREQGMLRTLINVGDLGPTEEPFPRHEAHAVGEEPKTERLLLHGEPYFNALDSPGLDEWSRLRLLRLGKQSDVGVPIVIDHETWGEVYATTAPGQLRFGADDVRLLEAVARQIAIAISRAELFSRVSRLAYEDALTGLANRRAAEDSLERAALRASDRGSPLAVLLCDVDELKTINDTKGHEAGDRTLRVVADALVTAASGRPGALVARLSGDEFCVVMEGAGLTEAREVAATAIGQLAGNGNGAAAVSVSFGAAVHGPGVETPAQLLRAADAAQYRAKRNGGGQFFTAETDGAPSPGGSDRRALRRGVRERVRAALEEATGRLDGRLARDAAVDRFEAIAIALSEALNAPAWAVSFAPDGAGIIHTVSAADDRHTRRHGVRHDFDGDTFPVADYPATERLIVAGEGAFVVLRDDPDADPAERGILEHSHHDAVLCAATADTRGTWLVELYADARSASLAEAELELRLLMRAAIPPRGEWGAGHELLVRRSRQLELASGLAARLAGETDERAILDATVAELGDGLGFGACGIVRLRGDGWLELVAGRGSFGDPRWRELAQRGDVGLIGRCLREGRPVIVGEVRREPDYHPTPATPDTRSELDVPVVVDGRVWGAITTQDAARDAFDDEHARLLAAVAGKLGAALSGASLHDRLERAYLGTAEALVAAVEAKDAESVAHPGSIVRQAEAVGRRLGMPAGELRMLRYAAALHDVGKLTVPDHVLGKPGPLTPHERSLVERHPLAGERILAPIEPLTDVLPLVRASHERWDGRGYPDGLAGEQIPLGARIVFACDCYDAMTSVRPYRPALPPDVARAELRRVAGAQLDPEVVRALLAALG